MDFIGYDSVKTRDFLTKAFNFSTELEAIGRTCLEAFPGKRGEIYTQVHNQVRTTDSTAWASSKLLRTATDAVTIPAPPVAHFTCHPQRRRQIGVWAGWLFPKR